jgi:hypothetical protein
VKGFLSFSPLAFTHVPPDVTTAKLCEDWILAILFGTVCTQLMDNLGEEISDFRLCYGRFSLTEIEAYF